MFAGTYGSPYGPRYGNLNRVFLARPLIALRNFARHSAVVFGANVYAKPPTVVATRWPKSALSVSGIAVILPVPVVLRL